MTYEDLAQRVVAGDQRAIARAISVVEDGATEAAPLLGPLFGRAGRARVVGLTGPPGVGKSTLVDRLTAEWRSAGQSVGIIAVDPTSPFTGGAVLGDRVRMQAHAGDSGVYVRSMATRGHLGGLAQATGDAVVVLDAAGHDVIVIETVGVGQGEVEIARTADVSRGYPQWSLSQTATPTLGHERGTRILAAPAPGRASCISRQAPPGARVDPKLSTWSSHTSSVLGSARAAAKKAHGPTVRSRVPHRDPTTDGTGR